MNGFDGKWHLDLAYQYLPIEEQRATKFERLDGALYITGPSSVGNGYGAAELAAHLYSGVKAAGLYLCGRIYLPLGRDDRWIVPDLLVLDRVPDDINVLAEQYEQAVRAEMGQRLEMTEPFAASFDPVQLFARKPE